MTPYKGEFGLFATYVRTAADARSLYARTQRLAENAP